jgi:hypothetical protein
VIGKARRNRVQQPGTVLRDHLRLRKRSRSALLDEPAVVILFDPERTLRTYSVYSLGRMIRSMLLAPALPVSHCIFSALIIANPNYFIHSREKNLSVTDLASTGGHGNRLHDFLDHGVSDDHT